MFLVNANTIPLPSSMARNTTRKRATTIAEEPIPKILDSVIILGEEDSTPYIRDSLP
jgi:hypothetical protein